MNKHMKTPEVKLKELAERIGAHLRRFADDPVLSRGAWGKSARFWSPYCGVAGRFVVVRYVSYQGNINITKAEATAYLAKLDAGYVGRHFEALREPAAAFS